MPERVEAFRKYNEAAQALIVHDEAHDPPRGVLMRAKHEAQRLFFHDLLERVEANTRNVQSLADRVQGHISTQLNEIIDEEAEARKMHTAILSELGGVARQTALIYGAVEEMLDMLKKTGEEGGDAG